MQENHSVHSGVQSRFEEAQAEASIIHLEKYHYTHNSDANYSGRQKRWR
jgi:hypothetical protein